MRCVNQTQRLTLGGSPHWRDRNVQRTPLNQLIYLESGGPTTGKQPISTHLWSEDGNVSAEEECPRRDTDMLGRAESGVHALGYVKELQMWRKERGSKQENRCRKTPGWISLPKGKGLEVSALQKSWVWIICKYIRGAWKQDLNLNSLHSFHVRPIHTIWGDLILCFQNFDLSYETKCIILYLWCPGSAKKFFKFCNILDLHTNNI